MLKITCSNCHANLQVPPNLAGRTVACPKCKKPTIVALQPVAIEPDPVELEPVELEEIDDDDVPVAPLLPAPVKSPSRITAKTPPRSQAKAPAKVPAKGRSKPAADDDDEPMFEMEEPAGSKKGLWIGLGVGGGVLFLALAGVGIWAAMRPAAPADPFAELAKKMEAELKAKGIEPGKIPNFPEGMVPDGFPKDMAKEMANGFPPGVVPPGVIPTPPDGFPGTSKKKKDLVDTKERARRGTVLVRGTTGDGKPIDAVGFSAYERGFVLTSADVVGMDLPGSKDPTKLEIVRDPGTPDEKSLPMHVVAADRELDLALLKTDGKADELPDPIPVQASNVFFGEKTLTAWAPSADASEKRKIVAAALPVKRTESGLKSRWLFKSGAGADAEEGTIAGTPLLNAKGIAVGMVVVRGKDQIHYGLSGDRLVELQRGRIVDLPIPLPVKAGDQVRVPVSAEYLDPIKNIRKLEFEYWVDNPQMFMHDVSDMANNTMVKTQRVEAALADGKATAELPLLTAKAKGKIMWIRPCMTDAAGKSWRNTPTFVRLDDAVPVERRKIEIKLQPAPEERTVALTYRGGFFPAPDVSTDDTYRVAILEKSQPTPGGGARLEVRAGRYGSKESPDEGLSKTLRKYPFPMTIGSDGRVASRTDVLVSGKDWDSKKLTWLLAAVANSIEATSITVPAASIKPSDSWTSKIGWRIALQSPDRLEGSLACTYEGVRATATGEQAVLRITGELLPAKDVVTEVMRVHVTGFMGIDPQNGMPVDAKLTLAAEMAGASAKVGQSPFGDEGTFNVRKKHIDFEMERQPGNLYGIAPDSSPPSVATKPKTPDKSAKNGKTPVGKTPPAIAKLPPQKTPDVPRTPAGPVDKTPAGDLLFEQVNIDAKTLVNGGVCWATDGKSFYCLEATGKLRQFSADDLGMMQEADIGRACTGMAVSSEGLLAVVPATDEIFVVDTTTLAVRRKIAIPKVDQITASPKSVLAVAVAKGTAGGQSVVLFDARTTKIAQQSPASELVLGALAFKFPAMTPDGKFLFVESQLGKLHRLRVVDRTLVHEQGTKPIATKGAGIDISPDSKYVCLPCETGNSENGMRTFIYSIDDLTEPEIVLNTGPSPRVVAFDSESGAIYSQNAKHPLISFSKTGVKRREYDPPGIGETRQIVCGKGGAILLLTDSRLLRARPADSK